MRKTTGDPFDSLKINAGVMADGPDWHLEN